MKRCAWHVLVCAVNFEMDIIGSVVAYFTEHRASCSGINVFLDQLLIGNYSASIRLTLTGFKGQVINRLA